MCLYVLYVLVCVYLYVCMPRQVLCYMGSVLGDCQNDCMIVYIPLFVICPSWFLVCTYVCMCIYIYVYALCVYVCMYSTVSVCFVCLYVCTV